MGLDVATGFGSLFFAVRCFSEWVKALRVREAFENSDGTQIKNRPQRHKALGSDSSGLTPRISQASRHGA